MKTLFVTLEKDPREARVALIPSDAQKLAKLGWEINVESGENQTTFTVYLPKMQSKIKSGK